MNHIQRSVLHRLGRLHGMSEEGQAALHAHNMAQHDWYGSCRHCGHRVKGTPAELSAPCTNCGAGGGNGPTGS